MKDRDLWRQADAVLDDLLDLAPDERLAALEARQLDPDVEQRVRRLLEAERIEGVLDRPVAALVGAEAPTEEAASLVGRRFGPFEIEEEIGRGGMSVVFRARRVDGGFDQEVALKILTVAHLVSSNRIRQEKEILARLRHPNVATLIDGGVEPDGTSWLAMELVDGEPIDAYSRRAGLDARGVVALFLDVCDAVSYAHRNLVVHRDLKPGNILVDVDGNVRLLDFGIAKLLDETDSGASHTRAFTPRYAAPEQITGDAVTTATDVYGLGAVLHQLLTGVASDDGRPPNGISGAGTTVRPSRAERQVPGVDRDLDTVILKTLRDESDRRYPSAAELRDDLRRWLERRPVHAMPDSTRYRLRKLIERHRTMAASLALVVLAVTAGTAATWWQAMVAQRQAAVAVREAERATAVTEFLIDLFEFAEPDHSQGETLTVRQVLDTGARQLETRLEGQPEVRIELLGTVGEIYRRLGLYDEAAPVLDAAVDLSGDVGPVPAARARLRRASLELSRYELESAEADLRAALADADPQLRSEATLAMGDLKRAAGRFDEAEQLIDRAIDLETSRDAPDPENLVRLRLTLADTAFEAGDLKRAAGLYDAAVEQARSVYRTDHTRLALAIQSAGICAAETGDPDGGLELLEESLAMRERLLGNDHPDVAYTLRHIAQIHRAQGRFDEAERRYARALELQRNRLGENHPAVLGTLNSMAILAYDRGEVERGVELLGDVVRRARISYGEDHPVLAELLVNLAAMRRVLGDLDTAEEHLQEALRINRATLGPDTLSVGHTYAHLGNLARVRGRLSEAEEYYTRALDAILAATDPNHPETVSVRANLASVSFERGRYAESAAEFDRAFAVAEATLDEGHPIRIIIEARFARSLARTPRTADAVAHARAARDASAALYPPDHPRRLEVSAIYGGALVADGQTAAGRRELEEVRRLLESGGRSAAAAEEVEHWIGGGGG